MRWIKGLISKSELTSTKTRAHQPEYTRRVDDPPSMSTGMGFLFEELRTGILAA